MRSQIDQPGEQRALQRALDAASHGARFSITNAVYAAGPLDLVVRITDGPSIIHFVGHGSERRLLLVDPGQPLVTYPVRAAHLQSLLVEVLPRVRLVYFNTCESSSIAQELASAGVVDACIGIPGKIGDLAAVNFAECFYRLMAEGKPLVQAMAMSGVCLGDMRPEEGPKLFMADGIDPQTFVLVDEAE